MSHRADGLKYFLRIDFFMQDCAVRAIINNCSLSLSRKPAESRSCYAFYNRGRNIARANICASTALNPQPEGSLEAERLSLMRLSRCVIHSASRNSNNTVRKGTCYRFRYRTDRPRSIFRKRRLNFFHDRFSSHPLIFSLSPKNRQACYTRA